jgi:hypothetical protein
MFIAIIFVAIYSSSSLSTDVADETRAGTGTGPYKIFGQ